MKPRNRYLNAIAWIPLEVVLLIAPPFLIKKFLLKPALAALSLGEVAAGTIQGLVTLGMLVGGYVLLIRLVEKRNVAELSTVEIGRESALGLAASFGMMSGVIGVLWLLGAYSAGDPAFTATLVKSFVWLFVLALLEEVLFRGIAYRIIERNLGTVVALVLSATIFGGMHITNENATVISVLSAALGGLVVGLFYTITGRLWLPIFFHFGWNLSQIFWGTPMSGMTEFGKFFDGRLDGPAWLTGGAFGPENSVITLVACAALFVACFVFGRRRGLLVPYRRVAGPVDEGAAISPTAAC